jgi:uncharacterized membrane protein
MSAEMMNTAAITHANHRLRERLIANLLRYGTWIACALIAIGMAAGALQPLGYSLPFGLYAPGLVRTGVALFIALPVARVALMLITFLRERDTVYALIAALVLAIIAAGILIEI